MHPGTKNKINEFGLNDLITASHIKLADPLNYFDMLALASNANVILTDSGGLQKEAYMLQVPCVTLRDETEWSETVETGWNHLAGANREEIADQVMECHAPDESPPIFGDGNAAQQIARILVND